MFSNAIIAAAFATLALAAPAPTEPVASPLTAPFAVTIEDADASANLTARDLWLWANLYTYDADGCPNKGDWATVDMYDQDGYGYQCIQTSHPSLSVEGTGCNTRMWDGTDCTGTSFTFPDSKCYTGNWWHSVSLECGRGR